MLGDQLIKDERVALVELVKNAYDADATRVVVDFRRFSSDFSALPGAAIAITDNGIGMTQRLVRTAWMNPATPSKALIKRDEPKTTLGRVLQGEKGIGRFAAFKLGSEVSLITRALGSDEETTLVVDIGALDAADEHSERMDFYLDQVPALIDVSPPQLFNGSGSVVETHGTCLEVSSVRASWTLDLVNRAFSDLERLQPIMWDDAVPARRADFEVVFARDGVDLQLGASRSEELAALFSRAVLSVKDGRFDARSRTVQFSLNGRETVLSIDDPVVRKLKPFSDRFLKDANGKKLPANTLAQPECGSFGFEFHIFDFSSNAPTPHFLGDDEKDILRNHRIYLYRDGIRVYPYGDPNDDWLEIDVKRGTESAGRTFSNDQTVGYIAISQSENPTLRDKTSREGLLELGRSTGDLRALVQTILRYLRSKPYDQYAIANRRAREQALNLHRLDRHVQAIRKQPDLPKSVLKELDSLEKALAAERDLFDIRIGRTEQLAGVGLSVESASHDLILAGSESLRIARLIVSELRLLDLMGETVFVLARSLVTQLEFVSARFRDVQGLFVSTRQKRTKQDIARLLRRVRAIYANLHSELGIEFDVPKDLKIVAMSTEAAVLQLLINLVDNSTHWLMVLPSGPRVIRAFAPDDRTLVLSDSGPGVAEMDAPFIFEPFYSGKGEDGKGLGLYIARENGLRNGFSIDLGGVGDNRELPGATFTVRFDQTGSQ